MDEDNEYDEGIFYTVLNKIKFEIIDEISIKQHNFG